MQIVKILNVLHFLRRRALPRTRPPVVAAPTAIPGIAIEAPR